MRLALAIHGHGRKVSLATWPPEVSDWQASETHCESRTHREPTMTLTPEYGEEERMRQQSEGLRYQSEGVLPQDRENAPEREIREHDREDRSLRTSIRRILRRVLPGMSVRGVGGGDGRRCN
jgi:hypothetical protein